MRSPSRAFFAPAALAVAVAGACADLAVPARGDGGGAILAQEAPGRRSPPRVEVLIGEPNVERAYRFPPSDEPLGRHTLYWTRAIYSGSRGRRGWGSASWATDFPKGDRQFLVVLKRLVRLDAYDWENAVSLDDPRIRRFPLLYAVEVGYMDLTPEEIHGLRDYLNAGGMLVVDDFWGTREWAAFERNMRLVLPGREIVDIPRDHPLFSSFYDITEIKQVPNVGAARRITYFGEGATWERDGYYPFVKGILDDHGEIMVLIHWNTDLGDAWEWAEDPMYPLEYSTYAYEMGANMIVYGMSH